MSSFSVAGISSANTLFWKLPWVPHLPHRESALPCSPRQSPRVPSPSCAPGPTVLSQ